MEIDVEGETVSELAVGEFRKRCNDVAWFVYFDPQ
jgi:hypothetical protein